MGSLAAFLKELWGLFVDDGNLALALIAWVAICAFGLPRLPVPAFWDGPFLFLGCVVILVFAVLRTARGKSGGRGS
ncbi:MAG TPA: hypothetical protein VGF43_12380 [Dongiaceae bacterium]